MPIARDTGRRLARRALTIPLCFLLLALYVALAPLWIPFAALIDLSPGRRTAALRCGAFLGIYLLCEAAGILASFAVWLVASGRSDAARDRWQRWNFALQRRWAAALFGGAQRVFDLRLEVENEDAVAEGGFFLFLRHASTGDTLLASMLISVPHHIRLRYVMKRELLWDPCLDIVGNRLPNYFVERGASDGAREIAAVAALAEGLGDREGVLIYPEGTRFTEAKRARILERLRERGSEDLLARAETLRHVLPPRLGGPLGLLERNPEADVVFCAHTGFEGAGTLLDLWRGSLVHQVIRVRLWRVPRARIPRSHDARAEWLLDQWRRVDEWIHATRKPPA